jgi:diacylglycerol kinase (ATP)
MRQSIEKNSSSFSWKARGKSFVFAGAGILRFFRAEHNAWIHLGATCVVVVLSLVFHVSRMEAIALVFSVAFVWIAEMLNTAIEKIMDLVSPEYHPKVKVIKDVAAGAVLVAAVAALIAGAIIFIPKIIIS